MANRTDNFTATNGTDLSGRTPSDGGAAWVSSGAGAWTIQSNQAQSNGGGTKYCYLECSSADADVQFTVKSSSAANQGMLLRFIDASNYWFLYYISNYVHLCKRVSGTNSDPAAAGAKNESFVVAANDVVKVTANGSSWTVYKNGTSVITYTDASNTTGTKFGLYNDGAGTAIFDDFSITPIVIASFVVDRTKVLIGSGTVTLTLTGTNTTWSGSPFSLTATPTGWSIASQSVSSSTSATVTLNRGSGQSTLTLSDGSVSASTTTTDTATAVATGNSSSTSTWDTLEVPGNGHKIAIPNGFTVTIDANLTIGTSPSDTTTNVITCTGTGTLTVNPSVTLVVRGNATSGNVAVTIGTGSGGGTLEFDASQATTTTTNYIWTIGNSGSQNSAKLVTRGTSGSHSIIRSNAGGGNGSFVKGGSDTGGLDLQYCDFTRIGTASIDALQSGITSGALTPVSIANCTFTSCGRINTSGSIGTTSGWSVADSTWASTLSADLRIIGGAASGGPTRSIARNVFSSPITVTPSGTSFADCFFPDGVFDDGSGTTWTAMDRCFIWMGQAGSAVITGMSIFGPITDCYALADTTNGNSHVLIPATTSTYTRVIFDNNSNDTGAGDNSDLMTNSSAGTSTVLNAIICWSEIESTGAGTLNLNPPAVLKVRHCSGWANNGFVSLGDISFAVDTLNEYKSNAVRSASGSDWHVNYKTQQATPTFDGAMTAAGADYNCGYNLPAGHMGKGYNTQNSTGTIGAHDLYGTNPQWVDPLRNASQWALSRGYSTALGTGTSAIRQRYADAITALKANFVTRMADLTAYVRAGFAPTNVALRNAGHDGVTIGAVEYQPPPGVIVQVKQAVKRAANF